MTDIQTHEPSVKDRASTLTDDYSQRLDAFVNEIVPPVLENTEYAARCSALLIALNRQLARCAASFGEVHQVSPEDMTNLVFGQFVRNFRISRASLEGAGEVVQ